MSTILLTSGITTREIGMLTAEPIMKPRIQSSQNFGLTLVFTRVMMKVMMNDITTDVNVANKNSLYFADTFKLTSRTNKTLMGEKAFANVYSP